MYYILTMKRSSKMTYHAVLCLGSFALKPLYSMQATILLKETSLVLNTVHKLLKLLISKSDLMEKDLLTELIKRELDGCYSRNN